MLATTPSATGTRPLSLHDALPISGAGAGAGGLHRGAQGRRRGAASRRRRRAQPPVRGASQVRLRARDRKSTRLNSSHLVISYAVFCLKKKKRRNKEKRLTAGNKTS